MIGNISQFWRLTRELDINALRADFERGATLRVEGSDRALAERVAGLIAPEPDGGSDVLVGVLGEGSGVARRERGPGADAVLAAIDRPPEGSARRSLTELSVAETPLLLLQVGAGGDVVVLGVPEERVLRVSSDLDVEARDRVLGALVRLVPEAMLPLGRRHPGMRQAVADHLIRDAARVNAQFAALSSIPATLPLVGGLVGDMADLLVLTKNQVILLLKLAGLYGRDLSLGRDLLLEVAPVVGSAFLWRSTARTLVGLLPGPVALLPKTAVAYSGTFVVGQMARYYYQYGRKPSPEMVREMSAEGLRLARSGLDRALRRR